MKPAGIKKLIKPTVLSALSAGLSRCSTTKSRQNLWRTGPMTANLLEVLTNDIRRLEEDLKTEIKKTAELKEQIRSYRMENERLRDKCGEDEVLQ